MHTPDELREAVLAYYKALHEQDIDQLLSLYSDHGCSVADPVGTPPFEGKEQIRRLYKTAFAGYSPRVTADRFLFAPADNLAATQATGSMLSKKDGGRKIIRLNQEFIFDEQRKIRSMRAIWNPSDLSTPLRTVLITGGGSGIGEAIARRFSRDGFQVIIADWNDCRALADALHAYFIQIDVSDADKVEAMVAEVVDTFGKLDVLVNNAGILGPLRNTADYSIEDWKKVTSVNLDGAFYCMKYAAKAMVKQYQQQQKQQKQKQQKQKQQQQEDSTTGVIISTSSTSALLGFAAHAPYTSAKGGIVSLTRAMAVEYGQYGIRTNCVCPGSVRTNLTTTDGTFSMSSMPSQMEKTISAALPLTGMVTADDVAATVAFLSSPDAASITGLAVPVDRGYTTGGYQMLRPSL